MFLATTGIRQSLKFQCQAFKSANVWSLLSKRSEASTAIRLPVLTLYTKHPCPLCDEAKVALEPFKHLFVFEEVDITAPGYQEWFSKYRYDIPVFHFEGKFLMQHRVDVEALQTVLKNYSVNVKGL